MPPELLQRRSMGVAVDYRVRLTSAQDQISSCRKWRLAGFSYSGIVGPWALVCDSGLSPRRGIA
jgi:hypothetical protein